MRGAYNLVHVEVSRAALVHARALAVATEPLEVLRTTCDACDIRFPPEPSIFLAWFFLLTALDMPVIAALRWRNLRLGPDPRPLVWRGLAGAFAARGSFGSIMLATRSDKVGEAAVLRETSTVFAAAIGWAFLKKPIGPRRMALMVTIALGALIAEFGG